MEDTTINKPSPPDHDIVRRLQDEVAVWRAELQVLRSAPQRQESQPDSRSDQTFDFLGLPRELRNAVNDLCVVVGEVRIVRPHQLQPLDMRFKRPRDAKPEVSLFRVSKQIFCEAMQLYLLRNHFVVPAADMLPSNWNYTTLSRHIPGYCWWTKDLRWEMHEHLRSISISLDFRESLRGEMITGDLGHVPSFSLTDGPSEGGLKSTWDHHIDTSHNLFQKFVDTLRTIINHSQLRHLQINMQNTACSSGCHRLVVALFEDDRVGYEFYTSLVEEDHSLESLDFLGTMCDAERHAIREAFPQSIRHRITFHGRFCSASLDWDPDVEVFDETPIEQVSPGDT